MRASVRVALVSMVVCASLDLAGCATIDELKDTVSRWFASDNLGGHEGALPDGVPDATDKDPPETMLREDANKTSRKKDQLARKPKQPQIKPPASVPAETVAPQGVDAQSTPPQPAPVRLDTPWPQAPSAGTFSR